MDAQIAAFLLGVWLAAVTVVVGCMPLTIGGDRPKFNPLPQSGGDRSARH